MTNVRVPYQNQSCQLVLIDRNNVARNVLHNFTQCLLRSVSLSVAARGAVRMPALSVLTVQSRGARPVGFPLQSARGSMDQLKACLVQITETFGTNVSGESSSYEQCAKDTLGTALQQLSQYTRQTQGVSCCGDVSVLTGSGQFVLSLHQWLSLLDDTQRDIIRNVQVFICGAAEASTASKSDHGVNVEVQHCYGHVDDFTQHFQSWLVEQPGEVEHLQLLLPPQHTPLSLSLDLLPVLVSPHCLPFSHRLTISTEPLTWQATVKKQVVVPVLEVRCRVDRASLCQSSIHGEPLVARASQAWALPWARACHNKQCVVAVVRHLRESNSVLVCRLVNGTSHIPQVSGCFALLPGDESEELLLVALTPAELLLPSVATGQASTPVPQKVSEEVAESLKAVNYTAEYNPLQQCCGIHQALGAIASHSHPTPAFTQRQRFHQPARTIQRTVSAVPCDKTPQQTPESAPDGSWGDNRGVRTRGGRPERGQQRSRGRALYWNSQWSDTGPSGDQ